MKKNRVTIFSNGMKYTFKDVPEKKFQNYFSTFFQNYDTVDFKPKGFPFKLQIEPTNICNLHCPLCPVGCGKLGRKSEHMTFDKFRSIINDMEQYLLFLILWNWGEPFMNPELPQMIRYAHERGIKTVTSTNAHFISDEDYASQILESGLTTLIVAIDSLEDKKYGIYRQGGKLETATLGLKNLTRMKKEIGSETQINLRMIVMRQNEHEVDRMRDFAREAGADIFTAKTLNPSCGLDSQDAESVPLNPKYRRYEYREGTFERIRIDNSCTRVFSMANIFAGGEVVPCGYDFKGELKVGSILERPFSEIWMSREFAETRRRIWLEPQTIPKCEACIINYKFGKNGEFPEITYFNQSFSERVKHMLYEKGRKFYDRSPKGKKLIKIVEKAKQRIFGDMPG